MRFILMHCSGLKIVETRLTIKLSAVGVVFLGAEFQVDFSKRCVVTCRPGK